MIEFEKDLDLDKLLKGKQGFSLVELVMIVAIIGIMSAIAIPNFINWLPNYRLKAASQDMYSNFQLAKSTAIQRNMNCTIVFNPNNYIIFLEDVAENFILDLGETVIMQQDMASYPDVVFEPTQGGGTGVTFPVNGDVPPRPVISFRTNGVPTAPGFANGSVFFSNTNNRSMSIVVNIAGSISVNQL